jgi:glycosyltransferase involved in cell wall biosynthesis
MHENVGRASEEDSLLETNTTTSCATRAKNTFPELLKGKRILLATESLGPTNGVSRTTLSLVEYLRNNNIDVAVVAPRFDERKAKSSPLTRVNVRLRGQSLPYNPDLTVVHPFRYDRVCARTFKPDLVYLASPASVGFQFLLQIRQLQEPPVVVCNFQTDLSAYSHILFPAGMDRFASWLLEIVQGFLFNHRSVYAVFYPSSGVRDYLAKVGAPAEKLIELGRGVDTGLFNPTHRDEGYRNQLTPNGEILLVCVCRLAPEKGLEFLAKVAERLVEDSVAFKLLIVGGNQNPSVEEQVRRYFDGVKERVIFTGFLTGIPLARAYAAGDVFLHCSVTETFGLVVLEAMASGMPVIARDQGGPCGIVRHGKTGYLVPPQDLDTFVKMTLLLAQDHDLRTRMGVAALEQAHDTTWEKINMKVAWTLAHSINWNKAQIRRRRDRAPIRNWFYARYMEIKLVVLLPFIQNLRLHLAIGIVCLFWVIAVLPLLVHGTSVFPGRWVPARIARHCFGQVQKYLLKR